MSRGFTSSLENTQHWYGLNEKFMNKLIYFLREKYDIRNRKEFLNKYPQYRTQIHGLQIHFIHIKPRISSNLTVVPLLLLHGWPSSVREFYEMIPVLSKPLVDQNIVFELVIGSLPGFGYSDSPKTKGFNLRHAAHIFKILMNRLGHEKFYVHGGDWGAIVVSALATMFPQHTKGLHSNFCTPLRLKTLFRYFLGALWPSLFVEKEFIASIYTPLDLLWFINGEIAYLHLMGTKPDTIGHALDNSIEGLLAFNFEKLSVGSNRKNIATPSAGFDKLSLEALLDITLFYYWFPKSSTTSARFYAENLSWNGFTSGLQEVPISKEVPCGCIFFQHEIVYMPTSFLEDKYSNLVHFKTYKFAGHFAALEQSTVLADDIVEFILKVERDSNFS